MIDGCAVASAPVVGSPDQVSGAVSVGLNPVGPSGNPLTYSGDVSAGQWHGDGGWCVATYTPTVAARLAAGSTAGVDFDSFTCVGWAGVDVGECAGVAGGVGHGRRCRMSPGRRPMGWRWWATRPMWLIRAPIRCR